MINFNYKKYLYLLFGIVFVSLVIYSRFFRERIPKSLFIGYPLNISLCLIILTGIFVSTYIIYKNICTLLNHNNNLKETLMQKLALKFADTIQKSLLELFNFIGLLIGSHDYDLLSFIAQRFYNFFGIYRESILFIISTSIRIIIVIIFLVDVFIFFKLQYFYKILILFIIPIGISFLIFLLKNFASNLEQMSSYLDIQQEDNDDNDIINIFKPSKGNEDIDLNYHVEQFILCTKITGYLEIYDNYVTDYTPKINILIYMLYLIGWLFIIFVNISILLQ